MCPWLVSICLVRRCAENLGGGSCYSDVRLNVVSRGVTPLSTLIVYFERSMSWLSDSSIWRYVSTCCDKLHTGHVAEFVCDGHGFLPP